jgi:hypothetical protein
MPIPLERSTTVGIRGRAKALVVLLLPIIVFAAVVFLASALVRIHPAGVANKASGPTPIGADGWLSADTASSSGASVDVTKGLQEVLGKGATTVTTYTVMGKF